MYAIMALLGGAQIGTGLFQGSQAKKQQEQALNMIRSGQKAARAQMPAIREAWEEQANVGATQRAGMATNLMSSAGTLGSPGLVASRDRALRGDYMRELANLNAQLAQMRIGIEMGGAGQMGQMLGSHQPDYSAVTGGLQTAAYPFLLQGNLQALQQSGLFGGNQGGGLGYGSPVGTGGYQAPTSYYGNPAPWEHGYPVAS